ncbi:hypothetical protein AB1Y20_017097 [Prymnesium parvum]|uniref:Bile salt export pump n=1 Tax=Prymnesium parvum TaxID=97485 RepID=A0AB34IB82_PRYPA
MEPLLPSHAPPRPAAAADGRRGWRSRALCCLWRRADQLVALAPLPTTTTTSSSAAPPPPPPPPPLSCAKVFSLSSEERPLLCLAVLLLLGSEACSFANPLILATAYDAVVASYGKPAEAEATRLVIFSTFAWVLALHAASQLLGLGSSFATGLAGERVVARLRRRLYAQLLRQEVAFFDAHKSGELVSRLGSDTLLVQTATTASLNECLVGLLKVVGGIALMFVVSWQLTLIVFVTIASWLLLLCLPGIRLVRRLTARYQAALARGAVASTEALGMMRTVRAFAAERLEEEKYQQSIGAPARSEWWPAPSDTTYRHGVLKALASSALASSGFAVIFGALQLSVGAGFLLITYGELQFGRLTAFQSYQVQIVMGVGQLAASVMQLAQAMGATTKIFELLDREPALPLAGGEVPPRPLKGEVAFETVGFAYPSAPGVPVLRGLSLRVAANSTVALVGSSGCGKSTTLSLLLRFYAPDAGRITIDGTCISTLDPTWLRSQMAFVQQEPVLFGVTVAENVAYALSAAAARAGAPPPSPASSPSLQSRVEAACVAAHAHGFIASLADGYHTLVGERGTKLSGGQRQRLAVARALLAAPRVLLLDEATSALDAESEALVQRAVAAAAEGRSVVVVAHRLSTVRDADQIAVLSRGRVDDCGTHGELLARCETYRALVRRQIGGGGGDEAEAGRGEGEEGEGGEGEAGEEEKGEGTAK